jgi:hypothetical protein
MLRKLGSLFIFISILCISSVKAQQYNAILTQQGIGDIMDQSPIMARGMGGSSFTISDDNKFSFSNPATFSSVRFFSFESGFSAASYDVKVDSQHVKTMGYNIPYIAIALPLDSTKKWGLSIGALPFARQSYLLRSLSGSGDTTQDQHFSGNGQITRFYVGSSIQLFHNFILGADVNYLFGNETQYHALEYPDTSTYYSIEQTKTNIFGGFSYDAGFTYNIPFDSGHKSGLILAGVVNFPGSVKTTQNYGAFTYGNGLTLADSIAGYPLSKGGTYLPIGYGAGLQYFMSDKVKILADVYYRQWSKARMFGQSMNLHDYLSISLGAQYTPKSRGTSYLDKISYRAGVKYIQTYYMVNNTNPTDIRVSIGAGFPIPIRPINPKIQNITRNWPYIDLALEAGQLGNKAQNGMQQQYIMLSIGLHFFETSWFDRRREQ